MKVLFAHDHFFVKSGNDFYSSSGSFTTEVLQRYARVFDHITLLTRQKRLSKDKKIVSLSPITLPNVSFTEVPNFKSLTLYHNIFEARDIIESSVKQMDGVIVRLPSSIGALTIRYARKHRKPYLVEMVGCPWDALWNYGSLLAKVLAPYDFFKTKRLVKDARFVIYVSNNFLQGKYPTTGKSIVCSNVDIPLQDATVLERRIKRIRSRRKKDPVVLGTAAAVDVKYKGQQEVIKALPKLVKLGYECEYHLAGGGSEDFLTSVAERYGVESRVKFLGSISHDKINDFFDSVDIYIQPSKTEGLPRALIEAMSRGCPAIGSTAGGIPELLDDDFLFRDHSVKDILKIVRSLDIQKMEEQALRNFKEATKYSNTILDRKREAFLTEFSRSVERLTGR